MEGNLFAGIAQQLAELQAQAANANQNAQVAINTALQAQAAAQAAAAANPPPPPPPQHPFDAHWDNLVAQKNSVQMDPNVNYMKAAKCEKFTGAQNFMEWSTEYSMQPGDFSFNVLCGYLADGAKARLNMYLGQRNNWTHDQLIRQLGRDYYDYSAAAKARSQLASLRQGRDSISAYTQRWLQLATLSGAIRDEDAKMQYLAGARDEVFRIALRLNIMSRPLQEIIAAVTEEVHRQEGFEARRHTLQAAATGLGSQTAEPSGPMPMDLGYIAGYQRRQPGYVAGHNRQQPAYTAGYRQRPGRCNACGQMGHWARDVAVCPAAQPQQPRMPRDRQQPQQHNNPFNHLQNYRPHNQGRGRGRGADGGRGRGRGRHQQQQVNA